tara:strand:- start:54 stop:437 length:384 start_codon:yes stop_codon:yes gene_type:complete
MNARIRSDRTKDQKLQLLVKQVNKLKREKITTIKKRRNNLQKSSSRNRRNMRNHSSNGGGGGGRYGARSSGNSLQQRRQVEMDSLHDKHIAAALAVRKITESLESLEEQKQTYTEELDNAFMTGDLR